MIFTIIFILNFRYIWFKRNVILLKKVRLPFSPLLLYFWRIYRNRQSNSKVKLIYRITWVLFWWIYSYITQLKLQSVDLSDLDSMWEEEFSKQFKHLIAISSNICWKINLSKTYQNFWSKWWQPNLNELIILYYFRWVA